MLFYPVQFKGVRVPGLTGDPQLLPRKVQQIPGVTHGGVGWQGIIPSRAAKMGSIAVDKGIAKLGSPRTSTSSSSPTRSPSTSSTTARDDIRDVVERIMEREHPQLWDDLPPRVREAVHERVQEQLPDIVRIGHRRDRRRTSISCMDVKLMVIRHIEEQPRARQQDLPRGRQEGAAVHRQLRLLLRARCSASRSSSSSHALPALVGAADRRRDHRLRHQLARARG